MKFTILHPTARTKAFPSFPLGWLGVCRQWFSACMKPSDVEYVLIVHESRIAEMWANLIRWGAAPAWGRFTVVVNHGRDCIVDQANAGVVAASGEILIWSMDDLCAPDNWDAKLCALQVDTSQPIAFNCGETQRGAVLMPQIETRVLARAIGLCSTDYLSMFGDNEWTEQARRYGHVVETDVRFEHRHPIHKTAETDAVYQLENSDESYSRGRAVFDKRKALGFPRVPFPDQPQPVAKPSKLVAICTPGETFRMEWVAARLALDAALTAAGYTLVPLMSYSSNVYKTRMNLSKSLLELAANVERPDYVLWIDDDNIVLPEQALRLLSWLETHGRADGVTGWCWIKKGNDWITSVGRFNADGVTWRPATVGDLFHGEVDSERQAPKGVTMLGFPCFLLRFEVMEHLGWKAFRPMLTDATEEGFTGEDGAFCARAMRAGLKFYVDPMVKVQHIKPQGLEPDAPALESLCTEYRACVNGLPVETGQGAIV